MISEIIFLEPKQGNAIMTDDTASALLQDR